MTQENSAKVSFILVVFLGLLTAITPLATDLYYQHYQLCLVN